MPGGGSSLTNDARQAATVAFTKSLDDQKRALETQVQVLALSHNGFTALAADQLKAKLEADALKQGILGQTQAEIDQVVAIQRGVDAKERQIRADAEDRVSAQTLQEKQLELSLMGKSAELRAQELADLRTRNQLVNEGFTGQALEDEYQKRVKINREIATAEVGIIRATAAQKSFISDVKALGSFATSAFDQLAFGTGTWDQRLQKIGQDFERLIFQLTVIRPFERELDLLSGSNKVQIGRASCRERV